MKNLATALSVALMMLVFARPDAEAREVEGIAAIVNDEVISLYDVDQRVDLFFATSGLEKSPEMRERMRAQVLRSLVDEKLQMQEADRVEIEIEDAEIEKSMERLAGEGQMDIAGIQKFLKENNIEDETLKTQLEAELAWNQFVRRNFSARVKIGDQEIDEQYSKAVRAVNQTRYSVAEILLNLDAFASEAQVAALSQEIVKQLQAGVDFGAVARQFSIAPTASRGGQLGWITADQLDPRLGNVVKQMQAGQISPPIPTAAGVYILGLIEKRAGGNNPGKNKFDVLTIGFDKKTKASRVDKFIADFKTCRRAQSAAKKLNAKAARTGLREMRSLQPTMRNAVGNLDAGQLSAPVSTAEGAQLFIVCDRKDDLGIDISRDQISDNIFAQRMAMMARRHLRDLRRDAVVEYR
jgi:peptidyl-prolyl cis-trans isomerase SurA